MKTKETAIPDVSHSKSVHLKGSVRELAARDIDTMYEIINEAAKAYGQVLPPQAYHEPQMPMNELRREIERIRFFVYEENGELLGVIGYEYVEDVALIRHAYVRPGAQRKGIGTLLLHHIESIIMQSQRTMKIIIGTYTTATWAISFYEKHGYRKSTNPQHILARYYDIPEVQRVNSLILEKDLVESGGSWGSGTALSVL